MIILYSKPTILFMCFTVGQTPFLKILYSIAYGSREENVDIYFSNLLTQQYFYNHPFLAAQHS